MSVISQLDVLISATTTPLQKAFKKTEGLAKDFNSRVSKVVAGPGGIGAAIGGAIGGISVAAGVKYAVGQFMQIQEATTKLQTAFKATNSAAGLSVGAVVDYAKQLSTTTTFSASATTAAAAALAKFQNIKGSTFTNTIKQAQNLSVVMGKDLTSSATELGAALQNPKQGWQQLAAAGVMFPTRKSRRSRISRTQAKRPKHKMLSCKPWRNNMGMPPRQRAARSEASSTFCTTHSRTSLR